MQHSFIKITDSSDRVKVADSPVVQIEAATSYYWLISAFIFSLLSVCVTARSGCFRFLWYRGLMTWMTPSCSTSFLCLKNWAKLMTFTPGWTSSVDIRPFVVCLQWDVWNSRWEHVGTANAVQRSVAKAEADCPHLTFLLLCLHWKNTSASLDILHLIS